MEYPGPIVDTAWLMANYDQPAVRIFDARSFDRYFAGTLPAATHLDTNQIRLSTSDQSAIDQFVATGEEALRRAGLNGGEIVVFVEDISGTLSARGVWLLDALGHGGGTMLDGGLRAWLEAGNALVAPPSAPAIGTFKAAYNAAVSATAQDLIAGGTEQSLQIVDTRANQEWMAGIVPTARHIDWMRTLQRDGRFLPLAELADLYADNGISQDRPVATYCGSGFRAAHSYVILKALGYQVSNYAPSWGEWGRRRDLPIAPPS